MRISNNGFLLRIVLAYLLFTAAMPTYAYGQTQPSVSQKGSVTAGHSACWVGNLRIQDCGGSAGTGTVTSVAETGDNVIFNTVVTGSPISTSGTLIPQLLSHSANTFLAASTTTSSTPTFRTISPLDLPTGSSSIKGAFTIPATGGLFVSGTDLAISSPGVSQFGGILAKSGATSNNWVQYVDTSGVQHLSQPVWSDIGGGFLPVADGGTGIGTLGAANQCLQVNSGGTAYTFGNCNGPAGNSSSLSTLFAATSTNSFDNANYAQTWTWNALTTQTALSLTSSTASSGKMLDIEINNPAATGYAGYFSNTGTVASAYALYANGNENVTGKVTTATLTVSGNAALSGTTTCTNCQIAAGNATLTGLVAGTVTSSGRDTAGYFVSTTSGYQFPDATVQTTAASTTTTASTQAVGDQSTKIANTAFVNKAFSAANPGYVELPSGIIMEWGSGTISGNTASAILLPLAFPNAIWNVSATPNSSARSYAAQVYGAVQNGFSVAIYAVGNSPFIDNVPFYWFAIGN